MYKQIYKEIKKYDNIVIARHIGPDPDALGSQFGLKDIILNTFPNKKVFIVGVKPAKFSYLGYTDDVSKIKLDEALLIVTDTPDLRRIDGANTKNYKQVIKIDHHPFVDDFGGIEFYNENKSSACEVIIDLTKHTKLKMNKAAAEKLFLGLVADTNRFMYDYTSPNTFVAAGELIKESQININDTYKKLYSRPMNEIRTLGYISSNFIETPNGLIYTKITSDKLKELKVDPAVPGNIISNFNHIQNVNVWMTLTEDTNNGYIRVSIRSNGPIINKVAENYTGGGHIYASGARPKTWDEANKLIEDIENLCAEYLKEKKE